MDRSDHVRELRDRYEDALDEAEKLRAEYHREVLKLHRSGMSLREIAEQLGISHQRVHQIVGVAEPGSKPKGWKRATGGVAIVAALLASGFGIATLLHVGAGPVTQATSANASPERSTSPCRLSATPQTRSSKASAVAGKRSPLSARDLSAAIGDLPASCHGEGTVIDPRSGKILARVHVSRGGASIGVTYPNG